jgi:chorismate mutase
MNRKIVLIMGILCSCTILHAQTSSTKAPVDTLSYYRAQIDKCDQQIIDVLGKRMEAARAIGTYKSNHQIGVVQSARFDEVLNAAIKHGGELHLSEEFVRALYNEIHKESIRQQEALPKAH